MAKTRVLMLGPLPPLTGGMATVTANLRDSRLAQEVDLIVMNNGKATPEKRPFWLGVLVQLRLLCAVIRTIISRDVRLVHIQSCALFSFWRDTVHLIAIRALGRRVIWHLHDGTFLQFVSQGSGIKRAAIRLSLRMGSAVIVLSDESCAKLSRHVPQANWQVVSNGVALPDIHPQGRQDGTVRFVFLGNLTRRKGAYDLADAADAAARKGAKAVYQFAGGEVVAGDRARFEGHISELSCAGQIELLGLIDRDQKDRILTSADCIVLPSYAEGLPMALLEGMAHGLAAVATRIGSVGELIEHGAEGLLVEPGDVDALGDCIYRLTTDADLRRKMGHLARLRIQSQFSLDSMVDRIVRIYQDILGSKNA